MNTSILSQNLECEEFRSFVKKHKRNIKSFSFDQNNSRFDLYIPEYTYGKEIEITKSLESFIEQKILSAQFMDYSWPYPRVEVKIKRFEIGSYLTQILFEVLTSEIIYNGHS